MDARVAPPQRMPADAAAHAEFELFQLHFVRWRAAILGALALCLVVGGIFLHLTHNPALWWWIALQCGVYVLQALCCMLYERQPPVPGSVEFARWLWLWIGLTVCGGLISGALMFWMPAGELGLLLAALMVSGAFAIGEATSAGHERLVYAAVISQALMTCAALILHAQLPLGCIVCIAFAAVVIHFGCELKRALLETIGQRLHAQRLASALELGQRDLLEAQHQQSVLRERQRVMQDMHDGLGSSLSSALVLLERGGLDVTQAAVVMRECIDDLRLVVDSLEPTADDLSTLLGMLRYRLQHRIAAAGVQLRWQMADLPALGWLEPSLALDLLRLMQEAINNALKHAAASELSLAIRQCDDEIELLLCDDGRGFDPLAQATAGRGLRTMRLRAQRLHATLSITSAPAAGTTLCLRIPVAHPVAAQQR